MYICSGLFGSSSSVVSVLSYSPFLSANWMIVEIPGPVSVIIIIVVVILHIRVVTSIILTSVFLLLDWLPYEG